MNPLKAFLKDPVKTAYDGEDDDESILYVLRASLITTLPWLLLTGVFVVLPMFFDRLVAELSVNGQQLVSSKFIALFTVFWYVFTFAYFFQSFLMWFFNVYIITNKKIIDMDFIGLLYKSISETTLDNIEDITSKVNGTIGVIFNMGEVYIQTAGRVPEFHFLNVNDPSKIRDIIADLVLSYKQKYDGHNN
jgi:membrane protein YdbS with pleckstrin-like domain